MTKTWNARVLLVSILLLVLFAAAPVAATTIQIDLSKTYTFKNTHLSTIQTLDLGDPSVSTVEVLSTTGDNTDVRVMQYPTIKTLNRTFTTSSGTFAGNTITVLGPQISTVDFTGLPTERYYINSTVPTFRVSVPGYAGNPLVTKYNESWKKSDAGLFQAANALYLYNGSGVGFTSGDDHYYTAGSMLYAPYDKNDINYTLINNRVDLSSYTADSDTDFTLMDNSPQTIASTGKYFAGALIHDEDAQTATVYALAPLIILKHETPINWTDDYGTHGLPMTYIKGQMGNVTLNFGSLDASTTPTNVSYLFINSAAKYNMKVIIDTNTLAQNANDRWSVLEPSGHISSLLYDALSDDIGTAYTYSLTADGQAEAPNANSITQIAITPGYGISGRTPIGEYAKNSGAFIPAENFSALNDGTYYVYLMGTNANNDIVAFSQNTVTIKRGSVPEPATVTKIVPATGTRNTTVNFTIMGNNFPTDFGTSGVSVSLTSKGKTSIVPVLTAINKTAITGYFPIGYTANYANSYWNVSVITNDGGLAPSSAVFAIQNTDFPAITKVVSPAGATGYINTTINFTLTGTGFESGKQGSGAPMTWVEFVNSSPASYNMVNTTLLSINTTTIIGYVVIPEYQPAPAAAWKVNVTTVDGGRNKAGVAFTINSNAAPSGVTIKYPASPATFYWNTTPNFTLTGKNFQPDTATGHRMTFVNIINKTNDKVAATILTVNSTTITGYLPITSSVKETTTTNAWVFNVSTTDGGPAATTSKPAVVISQRPAPVLSTLNVTAGSRNTTPVIKLTGQNFYPPNTFTGKDGFTNVSFVNSFNGNTLYPSALVFSADGKTIEATIPFPKDATPGAYDSVVTTVDGGTVTKESAYTVNYLASPTITGINQTKAYKNSVVPFLITGTNFQVTGTAGTVVTFQNLYAGVTLPTNVSSVTPTQIAGTVTIPADVTTGSFDLVVITSDGGTATKTGALTLNYLPLPTITGLNTTTGYKNSTVTFLLTGTNFEPSATYVRLYLNSSVAPINAVLDPVSSTKTTGTFTIPYNQVAGKYRLDVMTLDGGSASKLSYFTISAPPVPSATAIDTKSVYQNNTFTMTLAGNNFQPNGGTLVWLSLASPATTYNMSILTVSKGQLNGTFTIPTNAPASANYKVYIYTLDGGTGVATPTFEVKKNPAPTVTSISPTSGYRNSTVAFTINGQYYQTQGLNVTFVNKSQSKVLLTEIYSISPTQIVGSVFIPNNAPNGAWSVNVSTIDGGNMSAFNTQFKTSTIPRATVTSILPSSGSQGSTVSFTLNGANFEGRRGTNVTFANMTQNQVVYATVNTIYTNRLYGTVNLPAGATLGPWTVNVTTVDAFGGVNNSKIFTVTA